MFKRSLIKQTLAGRDKLIIMGTMKRKVKIFLPTIILVAIVKTYSNIQRKINIDSEKEGSDCDFHIGMPR